MSSQPSASWLVREFSRGFAPEFCAHSYLSRSPFPTRSCGLSESSLPAATSSSPGWRRRLIPSRQHACLSHRLPPASMAALALTSSFSPRPPWRPPRMPTGRYSKQRRCSCKRLRVYWKLATRADHRTNPSATYIGLGLSRRPSSINLATTLELRPAMPAKPGGSGPTRAKGIKIRHHDDDQQCL
jgi:hypothetical protein